MNLLAIQEYLYFFFCCLGPVIGKKREKCSKIVINKVDLQFFFHNKRRADVLNLFASDIMKLCWLHVYRKLFFPPTD